LLRFLAKEVEQLTNDDAQYFNPSWSPDGETIVCGSAEGRSLVGDADMVTNIYLIDVQQVRRWSHHWVRNKRLPNWSPDGKQIAYLGF